jgi:hypothetical protein
MRSELLNKDRFAWMIGASVDSISTAGPPDWSVELSNGGSVQVETGFWRLSWPGGIVVCSQDHGHKFGLPAPVNVIEDAIAAIGNARIINAFVREGAPDLVLEFDNQLLLDVLVGSVGYECWHMYEPSGWHVIVRGSGEASGLMEPLGMRDYPE